jgi:hypothetical protein
MPRYLKDLSVAIVLIWLVRFIGIAAGLFSVHEPVPASDSWYQALPGGEGFAAVWAVGMLVADRRGSARTPAYAVITGAALLFISTYALSYSVINGFIGKLSVGWFLEHASRVFGIVAGGLLLKWSLARADAGAVPHAVRASGGA